MRKTSISAEQVLAIGILLLLIAGGTLTGMLMQKGKANESLSNGDLSYYKEHTDNAQTLQTLTLVAGGLGGLAVVGGLVMRNGTSSASVAVGSLVKVRRQVNLEDQAPLPAGYASKVTGLDIIDGVPVAEIEGPKGSSHWVAKSNLTPV
jgi:hypothetical protein